MLDNFDKPHPASQSTRSVACHRAAKLAQLLAGGQLGGANCAYILRPKVIVEIWPQYTGNGLNLRDRVLGEVERNSFMAL